MSTKTKIKSLTINLNQGSFVSRLINYRKKNPKKLFLIRNLLTKQKAELIQAIKTNNPNSIYELAKILKKDFKSVHNDIKLLNNLGVIELKEESKGKRKSLKPILSAEKLQININF